VSPAASSGRGVETDGPWHRIQARMPRRLRTGLGAAAGASGAVAMAAAAALALAAPASAGVSHASPPAAAHPSRNTYALQLKAMPRGTVAFGWRHGRLTVRAAIIGLTPGSSHAVHLRIPGRARVVGLSTLNANGVGQAHVTLTSNFAGHLAAGSRLVISMGTGASELAREPIAVTGRLSDPGRRPHRLVAVEVTPRGIPYGTPRGRATVSYSPRRHTLTVTVTASGITPGPHAAHIHLGSCQRQGPVRYMLGDLVANRHGQVVRAVRVFTHVNAPIPARGWYLNIHQGNTGNILSNGQPTIYFRPLICANLRA
jgi:Cu/Zn superoxide dismutase